MNRRGFLTAAALGTVLEPAATSSRDPKGDYYTRALLCEIGGFRAFLTADQFNNWIGRTLYSNREWTAQELFSDASLYVFELGAR